MPDLNPLPLPFGICTQCQHEGQTLTHPTGRVALYCPHHRAGGVLQPATDGPPLWTIWTPITREEFDASLTRFSTRLVAALDQPGATLQ